jgi:uncharacterized surface protein with fasciclin (FAS1) repeats
MKCTMTFVVAFLATISLTISASAQDCYTLTHNTQRANYISPISVTLNNADIVDTAVAAGNFTTLVRAAQAAGLVETLKGAGPFTVFAPTDDAFAALPAGTLENLLRPENREQLRALLTYHVVAGRQTSAYLARNTHPRTVQSGQLRVRARRGAVTVNNARVLTADIQASNGIIHVVDTVLMPR